MGFAETLEQASKDYRPYYLRYRELRDLIFELSENEPKSPRSRIQSADLMDISTRAVGRFQEMIEAELKKVNQFACVKHEALFLALRRICEDCKRLPKDQVESTAEKIRSMAQQITELDSYVRLNYIGFQRLMEKFDICLRMSAGPMFIAGLHCEPFANIRFDDILILLGLAWARWRSSQNTAEQAKDATWKPPESFIRNTSKYWVKPDKVVLLKTRLLEKLPYLLFGASQVDQEKLLEPFALLDLDYEGMELGNAMNAYSGNLEESQLLSSVYFDSPDGVSYNERIRREEGARLVRFRWYGENNGEDDKDIFVERKVHHEGFASAKSAKERCVIPQKDIFDFMKGRFDIDGFFAKLAAEGMYSEKARKSMKSIANEVNQMMQEKKLQPIIRTSYYRCAFQLSTDNKVRISLDTQMSLLNEFKEGGHPNPPWSHIGSDRLTKDDVYRFPYAILEIKLQDVSDTPKWLRQTLADIEAVQVHKFSKFQHAMAFLHPTRVPIMPHWAKDFREWHAAKDEQRKKLRRLRASPDKATFLRSASASYSEDLTVPKVSSIVAPAGEGHFLKDMENLDPKGVFANERTLLHYAEKGMYCGIISVALLYHPNQFSKVFGGIMTISVAVYYIWILSEYFSRLDRIIGRSKVGKNRELRLDSTLGPLIVTVLIGLVLVLTFCEGLFADKWPEVVNNQDIHPAHAGHHSHHGHHGHG